MDEDTVDATVGNGNGGALAGIRVLDLTQFLAGPYCAQILGDLGAEVIKLEAPSGDWSRTLPPHFVGEDSCYFRSINRNKESIVVDMKALEGLELVKRLAARCDIVVENFRPSVLDRLGLDYAGLSKRNPGLIWCAISGFGQDGPDRDRPAYDMIVQALSGGMSLTGELGGPPVRSGIPLGDLSAGMYGVIGVLAALEERRRSGKGQLVEISMLDCQISMQTYQAAYYLHSGKNPGRQGRGHESIPTYRSFTAADGTDVVVTANTEKMWRSLCATLDLANAVDDPQFATNKDRHKNREALWPILERAFEKRPAKEWVAALMEVGIPVAEVNSLDAALNDPQVRHRNMVLELEDGTGTRAGVVGNPVKLSRSDSGPPTYPPAVGAQTRAILADILGLPNSEIELLLGAGVVAEKQR